MKVQVYIIRLFLMPLSQIDKERLVNVAESGGDYLMLASQLGINLNAANALVRSVKKRNGVISLPCGCAHNVKMDSEMKSFIVSLVEENCGTTSESHLVKFLPPYSPILNPIEEAFSCWKYKVKSRLAEPDAQMRIQDNSAAAAMGSTLVEYRRGILEEIGESSLSEITLAKIVSWNNNSV